MTLEQWAQDQTQTESEIQGSGTAQGEDLGNYLVGQRPACPACGYCPCCGRKNSVPVPSYLPYYLPGPEYPLPYYPYIYHLPTKVTCY